MLAYVRSSKHVQTKVATTRAYNWPLQQGAHGRAMNITDRQNIPQQTYPPACKMLADGQVCSETSCLSDFVNTLLAMQHHSEA